jgi:hypothetical protein
MNSSSVFPLLNHHADVATGFIETLLFHVGLASCTGRSRLRIPLWENVLQPEYAGRNFSALFTSMCNASSAV